MTPEEVRSIRKAANLVQDRLDNAIHLNTNQSQRQFEDAEKWFKAKYPRYEWKSWAIEEKGISR